MNNKPDFHQIPRQDLRTYVLAHRKDDEALRIYIDRMRTEPGITRFNGTISEEDFKKPEELIQGWQQ